MRGGAVAADAGGGGAERRADAPSLQQTLGPKVEATQSSQANQGGTHI